MERSPRRIASPVNRTPSFEIAILTSPPLSPRHDVQPMESSPRSHEVPPPPPPPYLYSPRRKVHESIVKEVREYHLHTTSRIPFSPPPTIQIQTAPIAGPESTSSFHTNPEENREDEEVNVDETDQDIKEEPEKQIAVEQEASQLQEDAAEGVEQEEQNIPEDGRDNQLACQLHTPSDRQIIFPITPFYRRKGTCSKCSIWLGALCSLFFLLSIALFLVWVITTDGFSKIGSKERDVCNTRECIDIAFRLSSRIDDEIEPCENFYRHSCQRFHSQTADKQLNFLSQLKDEALRTIHGLLALEEDSRQLPKTARLARNLYSTCMNAVLRSSNAPADLLTFIRNFPCGPLLRDCQNFHADSYSWERHAGMLDWYAGNYNLIVYGRDVHPEDRSKIILQIKPPDLTPIVGPVERDLIELAKPSPTEFEPLLQLSLRQNLLSSFARESLQRDPRDVQSQLDEVALLMVDLYTAARESARLTPNTTYLTMRKMFEDLPQLHFQEFLDAQLSNIYKWTEDDILSVQDYAYFERLSDIMAKTSSQAVANYLLTVTVWNLKQYSYSSKDQFGWRECVDQISALEIGSKMYVDKASQDVNLPKTVEFLQELKIDFLSVHRSTPLQYLSNINRLGFYVGFPRRLQNEELVWRPVSRLALNDSDYFDSMVKVGKAERDYSMSQIGTYLDSDDTTDFPITEPTMLYNSHVGAIVIPLAFIEPPIYLPGAEVPMYGIYSSLGITALQMISKVFWQGLDKTSQLQCLDHLFRGFLDANRQRAPSIEPQLLATIELADAFKTTLYSYAKWQNDHHVHREKTLPAFDSTDSMKSLMLAFSTMFCSGEGFEPGSDYEAMINTVVANSRMFSIHFDCNNSSRLYNRRTCL